jgi:lipopolysaccharide export system protein LptC
MAAQIGNMHSKLVAILKVTLPLIALALLSTLFIFSRKINPEDAIPYATVDVADRLRDPKMTGAAFSGVTQDGASLTIAANEAKPNAAGGALNLAQAALMTPDGVASEVAAAAVAVDQSAGLITLSKGAEFRNAAGYVVSAEGFNIATAKTFVESLGTVSGQAPSGQITAQHMVLSQDGADGPYLLVFKGKVRLLYQPKP